MVKRIWDRCINTTELQNYMSSIKDNIDLQDEEAVERGEEWRFTRLNERMRFLQYRPGQYFKSRFFGIY